MKISCRESFSTTTAAVPLGLAAMYTLERIASRCGIVAGPIDWYLADLLCLPLVLALVLAAQRWRQEAGAAWVLPRRHGLFAFVFYALYFEVVLPHWRTAAVGDPWDAVCYFLGWLFFERFVNRPVPRAASPAVAVGKALDPARERGLAEGVRRDRF